MFNTFGVFAILYELPHGEAVVSANASGREDAVFRGDVHLMKRGQRGNAHFFAISAVNLTRNPDTPLLLHMNISDPT